MGDDIDNLDRLNFELQSLKQSQTKEDKQKVNTLTIEYDRKILEAIHNLPKSNTIQGQHNKDNPYNRMLWIDDYPANNKSIMDVYRRLYVEIDIALDTKQALDYLNKKNYDLIISDIGRFGELDAGIKMISEIKNTKPENLQTQIIPPIFIYASEKAIEKYGKSAFEAGASLATASARDLVLKINETLNLK